MKYQNVSEQTLSIPGIGEIKSGEVIETEKIINNPNFVEVVEVVKKEEKKEE